MRRLTMMAGAVCVALLMSSGAFAQVPPDPDNPNEAVPDAMVQPAYGEPINLETAKKVAAAAAAEAKKRNWHGMCICGRRAVRRPGLFREGRQLPIRLDLDLAAQGAHRRALSPPDGGVRAVCSARAPFFAYLPTLDDVIASRGGNPLMVGGKIIGAIGVSGGTGSQDDVISQAGVAALK